MMEYFKIYNEEFNMTLFIKAHTHEDAVGISYTLDWSFYNDNDRVDVTDDIENYFE